MKTKRNIIRESLFRGDYNKFLEFVKCRDKKDTKSEFLDQFWCLIDPNHKDYNKKFFFFKGGRGAGRTTAVSNWLIDYVRMVKTTVVVARGSAVSIQDSCYKELIGRIEELEIIDQFDIFADSIVCKKTGTNIIFKGVERNTPAIKSIPDIGVFWVEEAQGLSYDQFMTISPTISRNKGFRFIVTYNPQEEDDDIEQIRKVIPVDDLYVCHMNYHDNPWISEDFVKFAEGIKINDYDTYRNVYLGEFKSISQFSIIGDKLQLKEFTIDPKDRGWQGPYYGMDFGNVDPNAIVEVYIKKDETSDFNDLYINKAYAKPGLSLDNVKKDDSELITWVRNRFGSFYRTCYADSARGEIIDLLKNRGFNVERCSKGAGSIDLGIKFIRSFRTIYVQSEHKDCYDELRLWRYKERKKVSYGESRIIDEQEDKNNHYADAVRYAFSKIITDPSKIKPARGMLLRFPKGFFDK